MLPIKRILCPVDFSPPSEEAFDAALELAAQFSAELLVFHAVVPVPVPIAGFETSSTDLERIEATREASTRISLQQLVRTHRKRFPDVRIREVQSIGEAADAILQAAEEERVDLIVLSTHGATGLRKWIFGSIADKILRGARCDVLTIHPISS